MIALYPLLSKQKIKEALNYIPFQKKEIQIVTVVRTKGKWLKTKTNIIFYETG